MPEGNEEGDQLLQPNYPPKKIIPRRTICKAI